MDPNSKNGAQRGYYELDDNARKSIASNIANRSRDWCLNQGWSPEEAEAAAKAAEESFSVPRRVDR